MGATMKQVIALVLVFLACFVSTTQAQTQAPLARFGKHALPPQSSRMIHALWIPVLAACLVAAPVSQQSAAPSAPAQGGAEPSASHFVLRDGRPIIMRAIQFVSSESATVGQEVQFAVIKPVKVGDLVVIPEHAIAIGKVLLAEKKRRMGRGGKLAVAIERVQLVTGQTAPLRAIESRSGGGQQEMVSDMLGTIAFTQGLAIPLAPLFLLKHGNEMVVSPGDRFQAFVDGDVTLDQAAVSGTQPSPSAAESATGTVYLFRAEKDSPDTEQVPVTCGEALVGVFHRDQFVRLALPPGRYWFRAGRPVYKPMNRVPLKDFLMLNVQAGATYYLQLHVVHTSRWTSDWKGDFQRLEPEIGADAVAQIGYRAEHTLEKISPEDLRQLSTPANTGAQGTAPAVPSNWRRQPFY